MSAVRFSFVALASTLIFASCARSAKEVVVYASQDQVYAEPILQEFTRSTGIKVRAVYDSEAVKTVGLVNRRDVEEEKNTLLSGKSPEDFHGECHFFGFWGRVRQAISDVVDRTTFADLVRENRERKRGYVGDWMI